MGLLKCLYFETFLDKVVVFNNGKMKTNVDGFGTKTKIEIIDKIINGVRVEKIPLANQNYVDYIEIIDI